MKQWRRWEGEFNLFRYAALWIPHRFSFSPKEGMLQPLQCPGPPGWGHGLIVFLLFQPCISVFPFLINEVQGGQRGEYLGLGCVCNKKPTAQSSWHSQLKYGFCCYLRHTFFFLFSVTFFMSLTSARYSTVHILPQAVLSIAECH